MIGTYTLDQLAVVFQRSSATLRGYLDELRDKHGFPERLPCFENMWSKPAVDRWLENNGRAEAGDAPGAEAQPSRLARKYGGVQ